MRRRLQALAAWCACVVACAAQPGAEPLLADAEAVLRVNDLRWIDRELTTYAATAGSDPALLRSSLAQALFHARSLAGIDLARPAVIAWRSGRSPLLAMIPLSDRRAFLEGFGAVAAFAAPLVKVGERDGSIVYTQNTDAGLDEYRLLVQDGTAYLARTADECRLLATRPPRLAALAAPLSFRGEGAFVRRPEMLPLILAALRQQLGAQPVDAATDGLVGWMMRGWSDLVEQVSAVSCELGPGADGSVRLQGRIEAKADTILAQWTSAQKNAASRLVPLVRGPATVIAIYGQFEWQGQLDRLGQRLTGAAHEAMGDAWTAPVEESWRGQWEIADRGGAFAVALDSVRRSGRRGFVARCLREQPRAQELTGLERLLAQAGAVANGAVVEAISAGGLSGFRCARSGSAEVATVADDRRQLSVESDGGDAVAVVTGLAATLDRPLPTPVGVPAMVGVQIDLTGLVRAELASAEGATQVLPQVDCGLTIKATPQGHLIAEFELPLQRLGVLMREASAGRTTR